LRDRLGLPAASPAATLHQAPPAAHPAAASTPLPAAAPASALRDESLLRLGRLALGAARGSPEEPSGTELVRGARRRLAATSAEDLRLGDVPVLLADYRRLARMGWAAAMAAGGAQALGPEAEDVLFPGRFYHFAAPEVRLKEVAAVLEDYRLLLAAQAAAEAEAAAGAEAAGAKAGADAGLARATAEAAWSEMPQRPNE
jgi:hypothetical protein